MGVGGQVAKKRNVYELSISQDEVEGIIYKAIKELAIEEAVADIVSTWDTMSFVVLKYYKDERRTEVVGTSRDGGILENNEQVEIGEEVPRNKSNNNDNRRDGDSGDEDGPTTSAATISVPSADDNDDDDEEANDGGGGDEVVTTEQTADYDQRDGESKW